MSNPNIGKEASKGGKARWKGVSKRKRLEHTRKMGIISATTARLKKLVDNQPKEL